MQKAVAVAISISIISIISIPIDSMHYTPAFKYLTPLRQMRIHKVISPERKLELTSSDLIFVSFEKEAGRVPRKELVESVRTLIAVRRPISDGMDPVRDSLTSS
jgi:hypothetical protein